MALQRIFYKVDLYPNYEGTTSLATATMEVLGDHRPYAISQNCDLSKLSADHLYVYEYNWNLGLTGLIGINWLDHLKSEDALLVQLIFNNEGSEFSAREVFATLEYLPPTKNLTDTPNILKTFFGSGGKLASNTGNNTIGALSSFIADIIPSNNHVKWYLNKFNYNISKFANQQAFGIEWHITTSLIKEIGARLVGRVGFIFLHVPLQDMTIKPALISKDVSLTAKFGLKLKPNQSKWYSFSKCNKWHDFSMVPSDESGSLKMVITPTTSKSTRENS